MIVRSKFYDIYGFRPTEFYEKNNLKGLNSKYTKALADYLTLTNEEKKTYGIKKQLLGKHGLKATRTEARYFSQFLNITICRYFLYIIFFPFFFFFYMIFV